MLIVFGMRIYTNAYMSVASTIPIYLIYSWDSTRVSPVDLPRTTLPNSSFCGVYRTDHINLHSTGLGICHGIAVRAVDVGVGVN